MNGPIITDARGNDRLWPHGNNTPTMRALETAFRAAIGLSGKLKDAKAALEVSGKFTPTGVATEARRLAREQQLPGVVRGDLALQRARTVAQERLAKLKPATPDKTNLVAFFRRESIRDELRNLPREQRDAYLTRHAYELDPEIAAAVLETVELPWTAPEARLISPETRNALMRRMIAAEHSDELAEIDELEAAIAYAAPVIAQSKTEIQSELGINDRDFVQLVRTETASKVVWLKKDGARTIVMTPEPGRSTFTSRTATEEEIAAGTWFTPEAYQAAKAQPELLN